MISYIRMEARLIHGQTTTVLSKHYKCDGIIVVDDKVANEPDMKSVYKLATPAGVKSYFFDIDKGITQMKKAETSDYYYFIIFRDPITVKKVLENGYKFNMEITMGQQFIRDNSISVMQGCGLTKEEIDALNYIESTGTSVVFDPSCNLERKPWSEVKNELKQN